MQSTFVSRQLIIDNVMVTYEIIHHMKNKWWGVVGEVPMKIDIGKAHDRVD